MHVKFIRDQRGQAFSTFQLLISAVIALAILGLLLTILGQLPFLNTQKPSTEAENLIKSQVSRPGEVRTSLKVSFQKTDSLNAKAIASASGVLTPGQICLSLGEHEQTEGFNLNDPSAANRILSYEGSSLQVKMSVICDAGDQLDTDLGDNGLDQGWDDDCGNISGSSQTACLIALRIA